MKVNDCLYARHLLSKHGAEFYCDRHIQHKSYDCPNRCSDFVDASNIVSEMNKKIDNARSYAVEQVKVLLRKHGNYNFNLKIDDYK